MKITSLPRPPAFWPTAEMRCGLMVVLLFLAITPADGQGSFRRRSSYPGVDDIKKKYPAWRLAEEGKFAEAWGYVQRGEDTEAHYRQGVKYYNYWSARTNRRTPSGKPDPSMAEVLNVINEDTVQANERLLRQYQAEADKGNAEAKAWLEKYEARIKAARMAQDTINEHMRPSPSPPESQPDISSPSPSGPRYRVVGVQPGDKLHIRAGPGANTETNCLVENGYDNVTVTGPVFMNDETDWYPVQVGDCEGWARGKHLQRR